MSDENDLTPSDSERGVAFLGKSRPPARFSTDEAVNVIGPAHYDGIQAMLGIDMRDWFAFQAYYACENRRMWVRHHKAQAWEEGAKAMWTSEGYHPLSLDYYLDDNPYRVDPPGETTKTPPPK